MGVSGDDPMVCFRIEQDKGVHAAELFDQLRSM